MNKDLIVLNNIYKNFQKNNIKVLKNLSYTFKKGNIYSIIGPSGSGKSTLLNLISLIDRPTKGSLVINSEKINFDNIEINDQLRASNIGIIYQNINLLTDFTALENVYLARLAVKNNMNDALTQSKQILKKLGLKKRENHYPSELSGGESQRVAISRALINSPNIILADEPTGSLDQINSKEIFKLLLKLKNKNRVIIFATHNLYFAKMADCQLVMKNGRIFKSNAKFNKR